MRKDEGPGGNAGAFLVFQREIEVADKQNRAGISAGALEVTQSFLFHNYQQ